MFLNLNLTKIINLSGQRKKVILRVIGHAFWFVNKGQLNRNNGYQKKNPCIQLDQYSLTWKHRFKSICELEGTDNRTEQTKCFSQHFHPRRRGELCRFDIFTLKSISKKLTQCFLVKYHPFLDVQSH